VAVNITQGCLLLYFKYVIKKEEQFTGAMLALMISGALSIPLWKFLVEKIGKRKVSFCCVAITVPAFSMLSVITSEVNNYWLIVFAMATGPGCACGFYIPWLLLPDVIDDYTRVYHQRNESIFYGFFVFLSKLASGCVSGGTILTLNLLDYDANKCQQNSNVMLALRVICGAVPTVLLLLYGVIMYFFPLTEQQMQSNQAHLQSAYFNSMDTMAAHQESRDEEIFMLSASSTPQPGNSRLRFEVLETATAVGGSANHSTPIENPRCRRDHSVPSPDFTPLKTISENDAQKTTADDSDVALIANLDPLFADTQQELADNESEQPANKTTSKSSILLLTNPDQVTSKQFSSHHCSQI
jgi:hypothetical protein